VRTRIVFAIVIAALAAAATSMATPPGTVRIKLSIGAFPDYPISAFGAVWVESHRGYGIYRINPHTNRARWIPMPENQCGPPAAARGRLWFSNCSGETGVSRMYGLNPTNGKIVARRAGSGVAYAGGSLWTVNLGKNTLIRSDPRTGVVLARIKLGISPAPNGQWAGSACLGSLWTPNGTDGLQRTDLATNATQVIPLPGGHDATGTGYFAANNVACAARKVWVPDGAGLYEVDPATDAATLLPIRIGPFSQQGDVSIVSAGDDVYLRTSNTSVAKIDATTGAVVARYPATGGGGGIIVAYGSLWVVNANAGSLWREPL
jgi:streptogramin lyase